MHFLLFILQIWPQGKTVIFNFWLKSSSTICFCLRVLETPVGDAAAMSTSRNATPNAKTATEKPKTGHVGGGNE